MIKQSQLLFTSQLEEIIGYYFVLCFLREMQNVLSVESEVRSETDHVLPLKLFLDYFFL